MQVKKHQCLLKKLIIIFQEGMNSFSSKIQKYLTLKISNKINYCKVKIYDPKFKFLKKYFYFRKSFEGVPLKHLGIDGNSSVMK